MADEPRMISSQEIQFAVDYEDGERAEGIRVIPSAVRALEAEHGCRFGELAKFDREDWMWTAVHIFLTLRRGEDRDFDEWLDAVDKIQMAVIDDPTPTSGRSRKQSGSSGRRSTKAKTSTGSPSSETENPTS